MQQLDLTTRLRHVVEDYERSLVIRSAVERQFTIIGEALRLAVKIPRLLAEVRALLPPE